MTLKNDYTFAEKAIHFNEQVRYTGLPLPPGIRAINPYREMPQTMEIVKTFYRKFYNDQQQRHLILGINPSRLGGGLTGIPFTDPKRLISACGISYTGKMAHELSSVYIYEMIAAYGGVERFYGDFYINSPCPLAFTSVDEQGREKNYNYYDSKALLKAVENYTVENIKTYISMGVNTQTCFCLGTGKNKAYLDKLNAKHGFFKEIIALEHPRFIMQYKTATKPEYIEKYIIALLSAKAESR
jgi:hypothetical protein